MKLKALAAIATFMAMPIAASATSPSVQAEAPLSAGVLLAGTALVAIAFVVIRRKA